MDEPTPIDVAHAAMSAAPEDDGARLRFYDRLCGSLLLLLLESERDDDRIDLQTIEKHSKKFVLAFDSEDRVARFCEAPAAHVALSGRDVLAMLAEARLGLALNPGVAPSAMFVPPDIVAWIAERSGNGPRKHFAKPDKIFPPSRLTDDLLVGIDVRLARMAGLAECAYLAGARYADGESGHILGIVGAPQEAQQALARSISEVLAFHGTDDAMLDVVFLAEDDAMTATLARHGLRFDIPDPPAAAEPSFGAPGMDPGKPPVLR